MDSGEKVMLEMATEFPKHLYTIGKGLSQQEFVSMLLDENIGKVLYSFKSSATDNPRLVKLWSNFYNGCIQALSKWYKENEITPSEEDAAARFVITELSLHHDIYKDDHDALWNLVISQKTS